MNRRVGRVVVASISIALAFFTVPVFATDILQSPSYRFDESSLGTDGLMQGSSTNYTVKSSTGDVAVGPTSSANFQSQASSNTSPDPTLSFSITNGNVDLGNFTVSAPATTTATFSVSNYTSYGYVVQIVGTPPTNGNRVIAPLATLAASQTGTDQFGINLVANTAPSVGSNPDNGQFGYGAANTNYNTPNQYRFVSGDTIASAPKSSGQTNYTISYIVNVGALTPGGRYISEQTLIVTGTY